MTLELYRRHNPTNCTSHDSMKCKPANANCPIYVRGDEPNGVYVRGSLKIWTKRIIRDESEARKFVEKWEKDARTPDKAHVSIARFKEEYLADAQNRELAHETLRKYKHIFRQFESFCLDNAIEYVHQFNVENIRKFYGSWGVAPLTKSKRLERLRSIMQFAVDNEWLARNPASVLKAPELDTKPTLPFSNDEMKAIMEAAAGTREQQATEAGRKSCQRVRTFIISMRSTGLRVSDVTTLKTSSLRDNRLSLYQMKTGEWVSILLDPSVADALRAVVKLNRNSDYFFWTGESTVPAAVSNWRKRISEVFKRAGVTDGHTHRFRDTFAVALLEKGATIGNVSRLLGHTSIKITEKHYNPWVKSRQDALDADLKGANGWLTELEKAGKDKVVRMGERRA